ncbi:HAD hydrolase-like protein [Mucilaginibacter auburnensis]|uniref:phosphoglycolate phosphatase n=1 Tax=Mucilaginibacter auburnensis TaxID=1457233 RepID=A0A2H9VLD5_9SPHI|nr:HAD hydrolase-like protein [Mucilaginibacter auburnensis]PJJ79158.1 phosphoglycolate phosphatase-like HAD superfamily hydrolase [Mucilaginibacter auburnensis]
MIYTDIDKQKSAFIFELDNVIYPEKDYLFQVYYLFASAIEYTDLIDAKAATDLMVNTYLTEGAALVFERVKEKLGVQEKYRKNFDDLLLTVKLPLKLLIYKKVLELMQEIVIDRKKIFIVTDGNPQQQLNKIRQTEWNGLEQYLTCYFTQESRPKPDTDVIELLLKDHNLQRREILMIGNSVKDELCAQNAGIDYYDVSAILELN